MDDANKPFEITPGVAVDITSTLFFELAISLAKLGVLDMKALGENLVAASNAMFATDDKRAQRICVAAIGNALKSSNIKGPSRS